MSTKRTENYRLHAWEAGDVFLREEINDNFATLDMVLGDLEKRKPGVVTGSYAGTGAVDQSIDLGETPRVVLVTCEGFMNDGGYYCGGLAYWDGPAKAVWISEGGFTVHASANSNFYRVNLEGITYRFMALFWKN